MINQVKLYTSPSCRFCEFVKAYLDKNKIKYKEIDVSEDKEAADYIMRKSKQLNIPVLQVDDKFIVGYNEKEMDVALKIKLI